MSGESLLFLHLISTHWSGGGGPWNGTEGLTHAKQASCYYLESLGLYLPILEEHLRSFPRSSALPVRFCPYFVPALNCFRPAWVLHHTPTSDAHYGPGRLDLPVSASVAGIKGPHHHTQLVRFLYRITLFPKEVLNALRILEPSAFEPEPSHFMDWEAKAQREMEDLWILFPAHHLLPCS